MLTLASRTLLSDCFIAFFENLRRRNLFFFFKCLPPDGATSYPIRDVRLFLMVFGGTPPSLESWWYNIQKKVGIWLGCWCKLTEILKWLNRCFFHYWSVSRGFRRHLIYLDICFSQRIYIIGQIETHRNCYLNELKLQTMTPEQFWFKSKQKESKWKQHQWSVMNESTQLVKFWLTEKWKVKKMQDFPRNIFY